MLGDIQSHFWTVPHWTSHVADGFRLVSQETPAGIFGKCGNPERLSVGRHFTIDEVATVPLAHAPIQDGHGTAHPHITSISLEL